MDVLLSPQEMIFNAGDSICIKIDCVFQNSPLDCRSGEIRFLIDQTLNMDKVFEDTTYVYNYCACGDSIFLDSLSKGIHKIDGNFMWNKGDWTFGKDWQRDIIIK